MIRFSFRQGMLAGFVLIVILLGGAALSSWLVIETFVVQSRQRGELALEVAASIQELGERTVDLERSARQFLLLDEPAYRQRFDENLGHSLAAVERLDGLAVAPLKPLLADWRAVAGALLDSLGQRVGKDELTPVLGRLVEINLELKKSGERWIEGQNRQVIDQLEANRMHLGGQIAIALLASLLVALAMAWWLVRPIRQLEQAIARLGEKRFEEVVTVGGPADLRQLGRRLDWLRQRLTELEADRERALRHVSHELKTPLTALREGVALLQEEVPGPLGEAQREVVEILQHNVIGLQRQIEGLLDLNAAAFGARRLRLKPVALRQLLGEAAQRRELHSHARHLAVRIEASDECVSLDAEKMAVVVDNLLSNAIDFSPEGGDIVLRATRTGGRLRLECVDQGPGVAAEDAERIFEPFVQGRQIAPVPRHGSGVGLSIVRELVRAMGGRVALVPAAQGAHFLVEVADEE
jgi:two-component system sensor histidine kinase GlrK